MRPLRLASSSAAFPKDDIAFVNLGANLVTGWWARLQPDENVRLQNQLLASVRGGDDFVAVPLPRLAGLGEGSLIAARREYQKEKEIVDARLIRKVSLGAKGMAFAELCRKLTQETGIDFTANRSVADDKVTIFATDKPLREIMRQVTQVFGYLWRRSGEPDHYQYELFQDLRSQLLEEELRSRDRNEALVALDQEMQKYRKFLDLSPDQARSAAETASAEDKPILEKLAGPAWAAAHLYNSLSPDQLDALRSGQPLDFSPNPENGQSELPNGMRDGILHSLSKLHVILGSDGSRGIMFGKEPDSTQKALSATDVPDAGVSASMHLNFNELGQVELDGGAGFSIGDNGPHGHSGASVSTGFDMATGVSPSVRNPENTKANRDLAHDADLSRPVSLDPAATVAGSGEGKNAKPPRITSADILELFHKRTGMDMVADYYTHLYPQSDAAVSGLSIYNALNRICDAIHVRWTKGDGWLRFRSASFFNDRRKEIPNRLLDRWVESRKKNGTLTADDFLEICQLSDDQLNATTVVEGVRALYGLDEWDLAGGANIRTQWRFVASLPRVTRQAAFTDRGLLYSQLSVLQQQQFVGVVLGHDAENMQITPEDLATGNMHVVLSTTGARTGAPSANDDENNGKPTAKFVYRFDGPNIGKWTKEVTPWGTSSGGDRGDGGGSQRSQTQERRRQGP